MENLDATRKTERGKKKKEPGKIYVLIHICGREHFLNAFNTLTVTGKKKSSEENSDLKVKEKKKVQCNTSL